MVCSNLNLGIFKIQLFICSICVYFRGLESLMGGDRVGQPGGGAGGGAEGHLPEGHQPDTKSYIKQEVITEDHIGKGSGQLGDN